MKLESGQVWENENSCIVLYEGIGFHAHEFYIYYIHNGANPNLIGRVSGPITGDSLIKTFTIFNHKLKGRITYKIEPMESYAK